MNGHSDTVTVFAVHLLGLNAQTGHKLALTIAFAAAAWLIGMALRRLLAAAGSSSGSERFRFWSQQVTAILLAAALVLGVLSIWFDNPARLGAASGLVAAGLAFAMQRVVTSFAGYLLILRGKTFNVGDRIVMGGVRGDVISLSFMQTKIMEMGQPPPVQDADPAVWIHSRQFTGRIVTVTNDKIFDTPVYNYTHHFPYIWEEIRLPVHYDQDRARAEAILLEAARTHALGPGKIEREKLDELDKLYGLKDLEIEPRTFWRLTDNWLEIAVRFLTPDHGTRPIKDAMSRDILAGLDAAGMSVASATSEVTIFRGDRPPPVPAPAKEP